MNGPAAVETGDAVAHVIAVAAFARTDIPTVGQRVAKRQRIAVLQIIARHGRTGIIRRAADGIHPAGIDGKYLFSEDVGGVRQRDLIVVDAAPERRFFFQRHLRNQLPGTLLHLGSNTHLCFCRDCTTKQ